MIVLGLLAGLMSASNAAGASDALTGRVFASVEASDTGAPVGGIEVTLFDVATARPVATLITNPADHGDLPGAVVFDDIDPGEYVASYRDLSGVYDPEWSGGAPNALIAEVHVVVAGTVDGFSPIVMAPSTGWVAAPVELTGPTVSPIEVTLFDVATASPVATATTNGPDAIDFPSTAVFEDVKPGEYVASYRDPSGVFAAQWSGGATSAVVAEVLTVEADRDHGFGTAFMTPSTGRVFASVDDATTGERLGGISVTLFDVITGDAVAAAVTTSPDDDEHAGTAIFDDVVPGDYIARYHDPVGVYEARWSGSVASPQEAEVQPVHAATDGFFSTVSLAPPADPPDDGPGSLTWLVTDSATGDAPAENVVVTVFDAFAMTSVAERIVADGTGSFSVDLPSGTYVVHHEDPDGRYQPVWYGGTSLVTTSTPVVISSGETTAGGQAVDPVAPAAPPPLPPFTTSVTGRVEELVHGPDGSDWTGSPGAEVTIIDAETAAVVTTATTDATGQYEVDLPTPRTYLALANDGELSGESSAGRVESGHTTLPTVPFFSTDFIPVPSGTATIRQLVPNGVTVHVVDLVSGATVASAVSSGVFTATVPAPGSYGLFAAVDPDRRYQCTWLQLSDPPAPCDSDFYPIRHLSLDADEHHDGTFALRAIESESPEVAEIGGTVTDADGLPIAGIRARVLEAETGEVWTVASTNPSGVYVTEGLVGGSYVVRFSDSGGAYVPEFAADGSIVTDAVAVTIATTDPVVIDKQLDLVSGDPIPGPASITGEVRGTSFEPLPGIEVQVLDQTSLEVVASQTTDLEGRFDFEVTAPIAVLVRFRDPTGVHQGSFHGTAGGGEAVTGESNVRDALTISLEPGQHQGVHSEMLPLGGTIVGQVRHPYDLDSAGVGGAVVTVIDVATGDIAASAVADAFGDYQAVVPRPGSFVLHVTDPSGDHHPTVAPGAGPLNEAFPQALDPGDRQQVDVDVLPTWAELGGEVQAEEGFAPPLAGIELTVYDIATLEVLDVFVSDADGRFHGTIPAPADVIFALYDPSGARESMFYPHGGRISDASVERTAPGQGLEINGALALADQAPVVADDAYSTDQDTPLVIVGPGVLANDSDPEAQTLTATLAEPPLNGTVDVGGDGGFVYQPAVGFHGADSFTYLASDGVLTTEATVTITVNEVIPVNTPPSLTNVACQPSDPIAVGSSGTVTATLGDPDDGDSHILTIDWGDGIVEDADVAPGNVGGAHTYAGVGVFEVSLTVVDGAGDAASAPCADYIVVYDPNAGFVTGGGWFESPPGAYTPAPALSGTASFGFVSQYKKGAHTPTGTTEFQLDAAGLEFASTSYEWLVVAGNRAQFKGTGTIDGSEEVRFMVTATDGDGGDGDGVDRFRIKIWDPSTDEVVYDNELGLPNEESPSTGLGGGSIVVHARRVHRS